MLTRVPVLILAVIVMLALCQEPEKPEKRPALLSRYGRAVLPRYGKRSGNLMESSQNSLTEESSDVVCQLIDGKYICLPVDAVRFRPFFL
ncbi:LURY-1-2 [Caenorhabditis elegans]|uniref:Luqin-like RYamide peptides lury-1 n=1 Tax=Caenorhabditis elegans TaxID=6239 RepID=LURY1_CAEEL|nr:LURY-1-2 [Caenorhabditis elegans]Q9XW71.2 RecName: Full=Luqin-like RYamide peptides lury-1; Contains: RecName: Full=LURY-1-1; Contains: RecName: Full=LURY-1-2; Flags: Precursor [Caenorhabditis elegans]CAA22099.2 LURY-1-2 [Caenorhabditis elegans]|eukprot:NP_001255160.1 LURY-1-2 [Caenorhabditis elegans]